jgi:FHA domain/DUF1707 SHOCT-like domain
MRASSDGLAASNPGVRASDAERDQAIGELRDRFAEGRLSQETFLYRMDVALRAKGRAELYELFADLPGPATPGMPVVDLRLDDRADGPSRFGWLRGKRLRRRSAGRLAAPPGSGSSWRRPPMLCLPPEAGTRIFTIGRELACDFTLADLSVSRWHARLHHQDGCWVLTDLGSTNGTRLNGWRVTSGVRVRPGDRVSFGTTTFVFTDRPGAG